MAKQRFINTRFWNDSFVRTLDEFGRYIFLYLLTNEHTNICGIYELPFETMVFETGLKSDKLAKAIKELRGRVYYIQGWVWIKNFERHQVARGSSKVQIGIANEKKHVPTDILNEIAKISEKQIGYPYPMHSISALDLDSDSDLDPDLDSDSDSDLDRDRVSASTNQQIKTPSQEAKDFFQSPEAQEALIEKTIALGKISEDIVRREIPKFVGFWTERSHDGKKQKWQKQETFEVNRRLVNWFSRIREQPNAHSHTPKGANIV